MTRARTSGSVASTDVARSTALRASTSSPSSILSQLRDPAGRAPSWSSPSRPKHHPSAARRFPTSRRSGPLEEVVADLPDRGDHQLSPPLFGPVGKLYFSTGTATNCGVVGADNIAYEWLRNPALHGVCDISGADVTLTGRNYETQDVTGRLRDEVRTGAFVAFGTETERGQVVPGRTECTNGVLRCDPDGSNLELLAWGLRNAFGLQHHPDGRLFATEHGIDEKGCSMHHR